MSQNSPVLGSTFRWLEILVEVHIYSIMYKSQSPLCGQKFCKIASPQVWKQIFWHKLDCNLPFLVDNIDSTSRDDISFARQWQLKLFHIRSALFEFTSCYHKSAKLI